MVTLYELEKTRRERAKQNAERFFTLSLLFAVVVMAMCSACTPVQSKSPSLAKIDLPAGTYTSAPIGGLGGY